jgi:hypothetical protein
VNVAFGFACPARGDGVPTTFPRLRRLTLELSCAAAQPRNPTHNIPRQLQRSLSADRDPNPRLPRIAPIPGTSVLRTGPTGLDNVRTAIAAAIRNPTAVPNAVAVRRAGGTHPALAAPHATATDAIRPPAMPPTHNPVAPNRCPRTDPTAPPKPGNTQPSRKRKTGFTFLPSKNSGVGLTLAFTCERADVVAIHIMMRSVWYRKRCHQPWFTPAVTHARLLQRPLGWPLRGLALRYFRCEPRVPDERAKDKSHAGDYSQIELCQRTE